MSSELEGKIIHIGETETVGKDGNFQKRQVVIDDGDAKYPQQIPFEVVQDKCPLLDDFAVDENVRIFYNMRGREYERRDGGRGWFLNLSVWRMEHLDDNAREGTQEPAQAPNAPEPDTTPEKGEIDEDIPF